MCSHLERKRVTSETEKISLTSITREIPAPLLGAGAWLAALAEAPVAI